MHRGARPAYLVLRTSEETSALPDRCGAWAQRTGAAVDIVAPGGVAELRAQLAPGGYAGAVLELTPVADDSAVAEAIARADHPVVAVSRGPLPDGRSPVESTCTKVVSGRGTGGFLWALWHLHALHEHPPRTLSYGDHPAHVGDLRLPEHAARVPIVVLLHGGFWRHEWERDLMDGLALDLTRRGYATWNVEHRRVGPTGGGWPQSCHDVVRAVTSLVTLSDGHGDLDRLILLGHSAGAQLALRAAAELRSRAPSPALVVALSGMLDLEAAARQGVGWGSVEAFLGADCDQDPAVYRASAPISNLPVGVPQLLTHGTTDKHVPHRQSEAYHERASAAGDAVELASLEGADHFAVLDPTSDAWATSVSLLERRMPAH